MNETAWGTQTVADRKLRGFKKFIYHWILCYYGYEEDVGSEKKTSLLTNILKLAIIPVWVMFIFSIPGTCGNIRAFIISEIVTQPIVFFMFLGI